MPQRRTPSPHSQNPSNQGSSSLRDNLNGSEAKRRHPSTFDQKDRDYNDLDDSQLKALCQDQGYTKSGKRADLIQRLRNHDARGAQSRDFTYPPPEPHRPVGAGWRGHPRDRIQSVVKDVALLLVVVVVVIVLLWLFLTNFLSYSALITALDWKWAVTLSILALAVLLQIGKCFCYKPRSGYLPTIVQDRIYQPDDPQKSPADSQTHRSPVSHTLQGENRSSHRRPDSNQDSFARNVGEADTTQPPRPSITPISDGKRLEGLPHGRESETAPSLSPTRPTSSKVPAERGSSEALPTANVQAIPASSVGELQNRKHDARSKDAGLSHGRKALRNDPQGISSLNQQNSDGTVSSSSLTEKAGQDPNQHEGSGGQLPQSMLDKSRRVQEEILKQKEIQEKEFQDMCQRFNNRPDIWVVVRFRDKIPSDKGKPTFQCLIH